MVLLDKAKHLAAIHKAPKDAWHLLVEHLLSNEWTVDDTDKAVKRVKDLLTAIPDWWTVDRLSVASLAVIGGPHGLKGMFELAGALAGWRIRREDLEGYRAASGKMADNRGD